MANFEIVLVGDSLGMVVLGYSTTQPVTMEDIIHHCKAVRRGAPTRFIVADLPFGSYESGEAEALKNSFRLVKEAGTAAYFKKYALNSMFNTTPSIKHNRCRRSQTRRR